MSHGEETTVEAKATQGVVLHRRVKSKDHEQHVARVADEVKNLSENLHRPVPNPAPLGLIAFGLTTALLQMKHTRIAGDTTDDMNGVDAVTMGFAMFFGGLLQVRLWDKSLFVYLATRSRLIRFCFLLDYCWHLGDSSKQHLWIHGLLPLWRVLDEYWNH